MDANTVFKRNTSANYNVINQNPTLIRAFLAIDGQRSLKTIASTNNYEIDDLIAMVDQIEKMGLIIPADGAAINDDGIPSKLSKATLPGDHHTGIQAVDGQPHGNRTYIFRGGRVSKKQISKGPLKKCRTSGKIIPAGPLIAERHH